MQLTKNGDSTGSGIFQRIKEGDEALLKELYEANRSRFINWFEKNHAIDRTEAIDLYQRAFTAFYFNVKNGKIDSLNSNIQTYLFGIGKNLVKEIFKDRENVSLDEIMQVEADDTGFFDKHNKAHLQQLVAKILNQVGEPCKSLLMQYYFNNFSMESIANNLGYKNENVAKKKKCLCLQKIRMELKISNRD